MKKIIDPRLLCLFVIDLGVHDINTNLTTDTTATTGNDLSVQMKTYYSDYLVDFARALLVHDQFGQRHPIPRNGGKTIEFRVKKQFPKLLTPLSEGVTPDGQKLEWSKLETTVKQYGGYVALSDMLTLTAIDNNIVYATELCGDQSGRTLDTITREVLNGGDSVQFADGQVAARHLLVGGAATASNNHYLTVESIRRAQRFLKTMNARPINGDFVAIIHPDVAYDLMRDEDWMNVKTYSDPKDIYEGEIGKLFNTRFVETTEAKIFHADDLTAGSRTLTVMTTLSAPGKTVAVDEAITATDAAALAGRDIVLNGNLYTIDEAASGVAGAATITTTENISVADGTDGNVIYPGEAGAAGRDVYSTLVLAADAYGITELEGGGLQQFVKQLGSAGTADPINQRATVGWKATKVAKRLVESFMLRVETASSWQSGSN